MTQASWQFAVTDPNNGKVIDFLDTPADGVYTRRLDDYCQFEATITEPGDFYAAQPFENAVLALRNGKPVFRGRIVEPFERTPRSRKIIAKDPFHNFYWRRVRERIKITDDPDEIAWQLIHLQNTYRDTGLRSGRDRAWGDAVTRIYHAGDTVSDAVKALALTHGDRFHFRINARLDDADHKALAAIETFKTGHYHSGARFEFGENTLENIEDYSVEYGQVLNRATVIGQRNSSRDTVGKSHADGNCVAQVAKSTAKNPPSETYTAGDSEYDYGLWEEEYGSVNQHTKEHLLALAKTKLQPKPPRTITVTPSNASGDNIQTNVGPMIFDDFDVGDHVHVRIHDYDFTLHAVATVWEIVVEIDPDSGQEKITTISFIDPKDTGA